MNVKQDDLEQMEAAWDRMSTDYGKHTDLRPTDPHYQKLADLFPATESNITVLDLGSGLGYALDGILPKITNAKITCMDVSTEMLAKLEERLSSFSTQIVTQQGSYVTTEIGQNQYDFVLSAFTVHHLPKPTKLMLFKKIYDVLKDGGSYLELDGVASVEQERSTQERFQKFVAHREGAEIGNWDFDICLTVANESQLLREAGFSEVSVPWTDTDAEGSGRAVFVAKK